MLTGSRHRSQAPRSARPREPEPPGSSSHGPLLTSPPLGPTRPRVHLTLGFRPAPRAAAWAATLCSGHPRREPSSFLRRGPPPGLHALGPSPPSDQPQALPAKPPTAAPLPAPLPAPWLWRSSPLTAAKDGRALGSKGGLQGGCRLEVNEKGGWGRVTRGTRPRGEARDTGESPSSPGRRAEGPGLPRCGQGGCRDRWGAGSEHKDIPAFVPVRPPTPLR